MGLYILYSSEIYVMGTMLHSVSLDLPFILEMLLFEKNVDFNLLTCEENTRQAKFTSEFWKFKELTCGFCLSGIFLSC